MTRLAHARIERAIVAAEAGTTGHVVVRVVPGTDVEAMECARDEFERVGLHKVKERNVALVLVAPNARTYAVLGDKALHERVGDRFWNDVVAEMKPYFARNDPTGAVVTAVERIGVELRKHFPAAA
ncbi:MAG: TPM domain-containing protein [Candidatus Tyrphobacter sp.]